MAHFAFNCYKHPSQLIMRCPSGIAEIILLREGVTQGNTLSMVLYRLVLILFAKLTRLAVLQLVHAWYADDAALAGLLLEIGWAAQLIMKHSPDQGYYMEPAKSVLVCSPHTWDVDLNALSAFEFIQLDGLRYPRDFIGLRISRTEWLRPKIAQWTEGVKRLACVVQWFLLTAFTRLAKSLQAEW